MENRYLFRAKRIDNGKWVEGLLTIMWGRCHIINPNDENTAYLTDPSTICQCTGLKDKNGVLIWENDIVTGRFGNEIITGCIRYGSNAQFYIDRKGMYGIYLDNSQDWLDVIGNIFDNKELLEQEV